MSWRDDALVSCLMVTRNRARLARRAVHCFAAQTWPNRELVIIDDGDEDYEPMLVPYRDAQTIHYHRFAPDPERRLGAARNLSLERANGDLLMQWDDDEWYHPERIEAQLGPIRDGADGSVLHDTLMHIDAPGFLEHPIRTGLRRGTPGTVVHRRSSTVRYPNAARSEDTVYLQALREEMSVPTIADELHSHLFIRCFHGGNTWDLRHFTERLKRRLPDKWEYLKARLRGDILTHRAFRLTPLERAAVERFLDDSRALGLLTT